MENWAIGIRVTVIIVILGIAVFIVYDAYKVVKRYRKEGEADRLEDERLAKEAKELQKTLKE